MTKGATITSNNKADHNSLNLVARSKDKFEITEKDQTLTTNEK